VKETIFESKKRRKLKGVKKEGGMKV